MFRYSFKILPDRLKLTRLYPCGSLGQSISFVFGARFGHFAATPQSDVLGIWSCDLGVTATLSVRQKMPFFRAFITLRSQFHLHHCSQRALTEIVSKISPNLGLVLNTYLFILRAFSIVVPRVSLKYLWLSTVMWYMFSHKFSFSDEIIILKLPATSWTGVLSHLPFRNCKNWFDQKFEDWSWSLIDLVHVSSHLCGVLLPAAR